MRKEKEKLILLTNDDGIDAASIFQLRTALSAIAHCVIVAPHDQKSASSHAISLAHDIAVGEYYKGDEHVGYRVKGTPADCVKFALCELLQDKPDLIISGVNKGPNTGVSVYYSGTVSAAREGAIAGIPSIAVSMCSFEGGDYVYAAEIVKSIAEKVLQSGLPHGIVLNVNVPSVAGKNIRGIKVTKQAESRFIEEYEQKKTDEGFTWYALGGELEVVDPDPMSDEHVVQDGYVSITPLHLDMTAYQVMGTVQGMINELERGG